jgi:hypothetical protein
VDKLSINFENAFSPEEERVESTPVEKTSLRIEDLEAPPSPQQQSIAQPPIAQSALDRVAERLRTQAALRKQLQEMQTQSDPLKTFENVSSAVPIQAQPESQRPSVAPEPIQEPSNAVPVEEPLDPEPDSTEIETPEEPEYLPATDPVPDSVVDQENSSDSEIVIELDDSYGDDLDIPPPIPSTSPTYDEKTRFDSPTGTPKRHTDTSLTSKSWEIEKTPYRNAILHSSTPDLRALKSENGKYSQVLLQTIKRVSKIYQVNFIERYSRNKSTDKRVTCNDVHEQESKRSYNKGKQKDY